MSRLCCAILLGPLGVIAPAFAQQRSEGEIAAMIARQKSEIAPQAERCPTPAEQGDEIVVCAENGDSYRVPRSADDPDRIRAGEAVSTMRAGQCMGDFLQCGRPPIEGTVGRFGSVPPMPPNYYTLMEGLPDAAEVVTDADAQAMTEQVPPPP